MNNNIKEVLDEEGIIYKELSVPKEQNDKSIEINVYIINLSINNEILYGGIVEGDTDKHVTVLFFSDTKTIEEKLSHTKLLELINNFNKSCRFGNFTYDDGDITYSLSIPVIDNEKISKTVFKYYFNRCINTVKEAFEELQSESRKDND